MDIVTPVYGGAEFLRTLGESLFAVEAGAEWAWWLVDDCGPERVELEEVYALFRSRDPARVQLLRNLRNAGFAASNNRGFKAGSAPLLLMLNSDIRCVQEGWLGTMAAEFADEQIGIVGARLQFWPEDPAPSPKRPPGKTQHAGVVFNFLGQPYHLFLGWDIDHPKVCARRELNAVTGACLMTRRALYREIGGLDPVYTTGNFEDVQFCLQARRLGHKVVYAPGVLLQHYSGGSENNATARRNEAIFQVQCKDLIEFDEWRHW